MRRNNEQGYVFSNNIYNNINNNINNVNNNINKVNTNYYHNYANNNNYYNYNKNYEPNYNNPHAHRRNTEGNVHINFDPYMYFNNNMIDQNGIDHKMAQGYVSPQKNSKENTIMKIIKKKK